MILPVTILAVSIIAAFRQRKARYGMIFALYALGEISAALFNGVAGLKGNHWYIMLGVPVLYFLTVKKKNDLHFYLLVLTMAAVFLLTPADLLAQLSIIGVLHTIITFIIFKDSFLDMKESGELKLFYPVFVLSEINSVVRIIIIVQGAGVVDHYFTMSAWLNVAATIYFCFFIYGQNGHRIKIPARAYRRNDDGVF
ncbi:MAG: hypothetical protein FMNOHCHN_00188 [Ignavibacteriaceae bacterium]|nr:hypothetical protein [Ignavibacteriaceae bacterium]